jgi:hypothetical protein
MKQFTSPEQTAKLIDLGFKKPKGLADAEPSSGKWVRPAYSIGELVEMLIPKPHYMVSIYNVGLKQHKVLFKKLINGKFKALFREVGYEPIDLLFNCIVKLKEEGVI